MCDTMGRIFYLVYRIDSYFNFADDFLVTCARLINSGRRSGVWLVFFAFAYRLPERQYALLYSHLNYFLSAVYSLRLESCLYKLCTVKSYLVCILFFLSRLQSFIHSNSSVNQTFFMRSFRRERVEVYSPFAYWFWGGLN
uniref:Ovule protein n=1 Tax=Echinococcus granulosus TaxID=6210 RepID=A0A068WS58_ECHGR|nr:hypothetical protein EgrG_001180800 [Echinococcus granulosus]